jgi:Cu(I)/Ag(I) efflux system membrane protein CusA/SilA
MINRLIELSLRNRVLVIAAFLLLGGWGYWALLTTPIDAIPDLSDNQVIVFTDWPGRSPQEVEDQVTYPLTVSLQGLPGVRVVRSSSAFGFSMINVIFEDSVDLYFARSRVLERLNLLTKALPSGVMPTLGPDATGVGHVFWYTVEGKGHSLRELRTIQDWFIRYQLNAVPGVAEVASVGGVVRQYQIDVDPNRLRGFRIPLSAVVDAVMRSNRNVGGNVIEGSGTWSVIRGLGLVESPGDLEQVVIGAENGVPIFIRQVAEVKVGDAFRVSALVKGGDEAVGGVVVARYGVSTVEVIARVKDKITALEAGLPAGVRIVPFYDRSQLIERAVQTLRRALTEEALVVTLVNVVFLLHLRSVLIVTIPIPLAVLTAFLFMRYLGITSNIMSLAGIAIAIGVHHEDAERGHPDRARGRVGGREDLTGRYLHGSCAAQHDRGDRESQARGAVATGYDPRADHRRAGRRDHAARRLEHLDPADHQPDQHADDRHPVGGRRQGVRL